MMDVSSHVLSHEKSGNELGFELDDFRTLLFQLAPKPVISWKEPLNEIPLEENSEDKKVKTKQAEQKRRTRIMDLMKDLEVIVFKDQLYHKKSKRITKEEILQQAITLLSEYRERESIFKINSETDRPVHQLVKRSKLELSKISFTKQETKTAFRVLYTRTVDNLWAIEKKRNKAVFLRLLGELQDLSNATGVEDQLVLRPDSE